MSTVILIRDFYPFRRPSGVISCLNELLPHLSNGRIGTVFIISNRKFREKEFYSYKGVRIIKINQYNLFKFITIIGKLYAKSIVIFSSTSKGNILFLWWFLVTYNVKRKSIFYQTTNLRYETNPIQKYLRCFLLKKYKRLIVTNSALHREFKNYHITPHIIYPGTNINVKKHRKECRHKTVSFVGHWSFIKGTDIVLNLSEKLPDIRFLIIAGMGKYKKDKYLYQEYVENKSKYPNVEIIGYTQTPIRYLEKSDLLILPYRTGEGVLGVAQSAIEAMALGIPVLSTNNSCILEILQHDKNGYVCNNFDEFKRRIIDLMNDNILYERLSQYCINTYLAKFHAQKKADEIVRIIQDEDI